VRVRAQVHSERSLKRKLASPVSELIRLFRVVCNDLARV
jgi:hypothetical protein